MECHCHANKGRVKYPPRAHCRAETHLDRTKDAKHGARGGISYYVVARTRPLVTATLARRTAAAPGSHKQEGKIPRRTNLPRFNCFSFTSFGDTDTVAVLPEYLRKKSLNCPSDSSLQYSLYYLLLLVQRTEKSGRLHLATLGSLINKLCRDLDFATIDNLLHTKCVIVCPFLGYIVVLPS